MGASFGPQLVGVVTDWAMESPAMLRIATQLSLSTEQAGMKLGLLLGTIFCLCAIPVYASFRHRERKHEQLAQKKTKLEE